MSAGSIKDEDEIRTISVGIEKLSRFLKLCKLFQWAEIILLVFFSIPYLTAVYVMLYDGAFLEINLKWLTFTKLCFLAPWGLIGLLVIHRNLHEISNFRYAVKLRQFVIRERRSIRRGEPRLPTNVFNDYAQKIQFRLRELNVVAGPFGTEGLSGQKFAYLMTAVMCIFSLITLFSIRFIGY
jgi:hypothetical protein